MREGEILSLTHIHRLREETVKEEREKEGERDENLKN